MKKALVITLTVAMLGLIGLYTSKSGSTMSPTVTPSPSSATTTPPSSSNSTHTNSTRYKDGTFSGDAAETPFGIVKIAVVVSSGKITDIQFLQMPSDLGHSRAVTAISEPLLKQFTLQNQNADIDFVSGATSTCYGYQESLQAALDKASSSALVTPSQFRSV